MAPRLAINTPARTFRREMQALRQHGSYPRFQMLLSYAWPGNVRELRNVVERLCILREGKSVRVQDLPPAIRERPPNAEPAASTSSVPIDRPLEEIVDLVIDAAIAAEAGDLSRAAQRLGVSVRTLQRRARS
jgi:DNA-binding NtrC family response regulator